MRRDAGQGKIKRWKHAVRFHTRFQAKTPDVLTDYIGGEDRKKNQGWLKILEEYCEHGVIHPEGTLREDGHTRYNGCGVQKFCPQNVFS